MLKRIILLAGGGLSLILIWFAIGNYRASRPIAEENLRGLALSLASAIENIAVRDPSLKSLSEFHPTDIAFFAMINRHGVYSFHSNPDLIGNPAENSKAKGVLASKSISEARVVLGTGETVYEFYTPLYLPSDTVVLQLDLHTYRADAVVRRAKYSMAVLIALLIAGWVLGVVLYRFAAREEQHQLEMAQRERLAQLGEMGAMLAHEIRNPLAGIKGYAQVIEKKPEESRNAGFAQRIVAEVLRLEDLVNDLLAYARSGSYSKAPVDLCGLMVFATSHVRHDADQQHVTIVTECPEGLAVLGNRDKLEQVLLNLATNALQAMPEGGTLSITAHQSGKSVICSVSDSGEGISPEHMKQLFEPFYTTKARGTGLGLAICKRIIEEHSGTIQVESVPGKGTSVSITLPCASASSKGGTPL
ncbi:MAG TPA: ATP-binding protein [Geobacteraceae bacterium]|nr:ATP-binding protein [Geobacteraceae bacterium]